MSTKKTVVISDIHMGTNVMTNWYRIDPHEPYLAYILQWVIDNKTDIDELIFLGDLFDFWTYPPDVKPPQAEDIIKANPRIMGPKGPNMGLISQVLDALEGRVSYLHGNHDITTTQEDLNGIGNSQYKVQLQDDIYPKGDVVYTHGHLYTLFNAPDISKDTLRPIPVGHFVTRAISFMVQNEGIPAVQKHGFGAANMGYSSLDGVLSGGWKALAGRSITQELLIKIQDATNIDDDCVIELERDHGSMTYGEAKTRYENLFSEWVNKHNNGTALEIRGGLYAYKAMYADYDGSYIGWFAQQLAFEYNASLVVMGHTHLPKKGLEGGLADYMNTGFGCVPTPDMNDSNKITFGVITTENGVTIASEVMAVTLQNGQIQLSDDQPHPAIVLGGDGTDYGCYITVINKSAENYTLVPGSIKVNKDLGYFVVLPPSAIPKNSTVKFWLADVPNTPAGSEGEVKYVGQNSGKEIHLTFECPYLKIKIPFTDTCKANCNDCGGTDEFYTKSNNAPNWSSKNEKVKTDNPFFVKFVIN